MSLKEEIKNNNQHLNLPVLDDQVEDVQQIGEGGVAKVYKVREKSTGKIVAVKTLSNYNSIDNFTHRRFRQEFLATASINHPNIIKAYAQVSFKGLYAFTMEYVDGVDLGRYFKEGRKRKFKTDFIQSVVVQILDALTELHSKEIIHRDLKPENILVTKNGQIKLMDLGMVKLIDADPFSDKNMILGTPAYIAPEYIHSRHPLMAFDIYALGVIMFELLSGRRRFPEMCQTNALIAHMKKRQFRHPYVKVNSDNQTLINVMKIATACDYHNRFQNAEEMREALLLGKDITKKRPILFKFKKLAKNNRDLFLGITACVVTILFCVALKLIL
jgi:eukaryotic-like serine/threonine-protein kinase